MTETRRRGMDILWRTLQEPGLEHLSLNQHEDDGFTADGEVLGIAGGQPYRLYYEVNLDSAFQLDSVNLVCSFPDYRLLELFPGADARWYDGDGVELSHLRGCQYIDIMASPFTNTLPVRRLAWTPGASADIIVAYIAVPSLAVAPQRQRYTCLELTPAGSIFRYEGLDTGFRAEVQFDAYGLVTVYGNIWEQVWPAQR
jgi:hypothetical protein